MSLVGGGFRIRDDLDSLEKSGCLSHRGDQVRSDTGSDPLALRGIREPIQISHSDSHIGARRFVNLLISDQVKSVAEIMRRDLTFLIRASSGAIDVTLLAELPLLVCFSVNDWLVGADVENDVSSPRWKDRETREARRM